MEIDEEAVAHICLLQDERKPEYARNRCSEADVEDISPCDEEHRHGDGGKNKEGEPRSGWTATRKCEIRSRKANGKNPSFQVEISCSRFCSQSDM